MVGRTGIVLPIMAGLIILGGCIEDSPIISEEELIVVWGFLYAGQPVTDIKLTSTLSLDADTNAAPPINDAIVTLIKDGQQYECVPSAGDSGYYHYPGSELTIEAGDEFVIEVERGDLFATGKTIVPDKPMDVFLSSSVMGVPVFGDRESMRAWRESENRDIVVTWGNQDDSWYYLTLKNIDENPVPLDTWFGERMRDFVFPPVNDTSYAIRMPLITYLGKHQITIFKVNQEYVDLYESREQDSRDLNEPLTNIDKGLGVFSAFNSESVILNVVRF